MVLRVSNFTNFISDFSPAFLRLFLFGCLMTILSNPVGAVEVVAEEAADTATDEEGFVQLLGDDAKTQWRGYKDEAWPSNWELKDGELARTGGGGDIMTAEEYGDFELRLEWKISEAGNSGIIYRVSTGDGATYVSGIECQVLDDEKHPDGKHIKHTASSLYGLYARDSSVEALVEDWNQVRIVVQGNHVEHWLNGKKVVECEIGSDDWKARLAESKFATWPKFAKNSKGHIAFQDHNDPVWYRNVRIKRLSETK